MSTPPPGPAEPSSSPAGTPASSLDPERARSVLGGVVLGTLLVALDLAAMATALPAVAADLGLDRLFALPVAAWCLGLAVAVPLAALAARGGARWPVLLGAAALLVVGGVLAALAGLEEVGGSVGEGPATLMAVGRLVEGAGAGGVVVLAGSALAQAVPAALQARVQAALVLVTGAGAFLGALAGGLLGGIDGGWRAVPLLAAVLALVAVVQLRAVRTMPPVGAGPGGRVRPLLRRRPVAIGVSVGAVLGGVGVAGLVLAPLHLLDVSPAARGALVAATVLAALVGVVLASAAIARVGASLALAQAGTVGALLAAAGFALVPLTAGHGPGVAVLPLLLAGFGVGAAIQGTALVVSVVALQGEEREAIAALSVARRAGGVVGALVLLLLPLGRAGLEVAGPGLGTVGSAAVAAAVLLVLTLPALALLPRRSEPRHPPAVG